VRIQVLFFGVLKEIIGAHEDSLMLPEGARVKDVFDHYAQRFPALAAASGSIVLARNQEFVTAGTDLKDGDEVALLPPVSGGASPYTREIHNQERGHFFALTRQPICVREIAGNLSRGEDGAVVTFEGVVRNNSQGRKTQYLEYDCYEAMAVKMMAQVGEEIAASHEVDRIAMVHRLGRLEIGEASVVIVVAAPHRNPAFEAALEGINRLKKLVPIWKKEYFEDGAVWVEGEWDAKAPLVHRR
jgi:molybdopterin synthase catalytic subunit